MTFEPYDVVVVPFPLTDERASRRRPALIVSSESFHVEHGQSVRFKLFALDHSLILRTVGRLAERDLVAASEALTRVLACDPPAAADSALAEPTNPNRNPPNL